ncbi:MAG: DUF72 domain-containing protein, partial [Gemmatimonadales bacterium]
MKPQGSAIRGKTSGTGQGKPGATLRFGPAGWMYKDWQGIVYPHPKPPRFDEENREWLGDVVRTFTEYPLVVEVRHSSWLAPEFMSDLEEEGVGFVNIDQ